MTFLRRGNCAFPHVAHATITLHRLDNIPMLFKLKDINCYEEYLLSGGERKQTVLYIHLSQFAVRETFDEVATAVDAWEAPTHA